MTDNDLEEKERIARELTGESFDELTTVQQNVIESCAKPPKIEDPFAWFRSGDDES